MDERLPCTPAWLIKAMRFILLLLFTFATSCCQKLSVRTEYINETSLASFHVESPDPRRECPFNGQQLIVSWYIPDALWHRQHLLIDLTIRYRNNEEIHRTITADRQIGTFVYMLQNEEFWKVGGILTYKILLFEEGEVTETWYHPLWKERICLEVSKT